MAARTKKIKKEVSISSEERLNIMLKEAEAELAKIEPEIEKLQVKLEKLTALKLTKQKLITLKLSLKSILSNYSEATGSVLNLSEISAGVSLDKSVNKTSASPSFNIPAKVETYHPFPNALFLPDKAFEETERLLKRKNSLNYDIFRAIVFSGGQASTEQIRQYLIDNNVKMPGSGKSMREVPLTDISSRANYLVRRGVVAPADRGLFVSNFGWESPDSV